MNLIDRLKERQGDKTQAEFASYLGISQSALSRIYSGERTIGQGVARKIKRRYPDLAFALAAFLLDENITRDNSGMTA
jgi:transcriptional regulator with XRE-family HTH domain